VTPPVDVPRHVWDAVNNAIHTSSIDGREQPISLCYVAVRAALAAYEAGEPQRELLEALKRAQRFIHRVDELHQTIYAPGLDDECLESIAKAEGK
jgi:hypothetical protein